VTAAKNNAFVYPRPGAFGVCVAWLATSPPLLRMRRAVLSRMPFMKLASDVHDVVYLNWVVPASAVARYMPPGVTLWERDGKTLFTILTYRHAHFGPALAGPLRVLFPSPRQSNWRFYVDSMPGATKPDRVILFVKNILDSVLYVVGSRLFSDALPSHLADGFVHEKTSDGYRTVITSGAGSSPTLQCAVRSTDSKTLPGDFSRFFSSWPEAVEFLCLQHSALAEVEDVERIAHAGIDLPIDLASVQPLTAADGAIASEFLEVIGAKGEPLCFVVPEVKFRVMWERLL